jgi:lipopolysaccharide heptosyltransferase I
VNAKAMQILIVKLSAIGDVIHALPALNALRKHFPDAQIDWLVEEAAADLLTGHHALRRVIVCPRKHWMRDLSVSKGRESRAVFRSVRQFVRELRRTRYDLVFDFQNLLKSAVWVGLARGNQKIGFGRGLQHPEASYLFYNLQVPAPSMEIHALERYLLLLRAVGIERPAITYNLPVFETHRAAAKQLLAEAGLGAKQLLVAIHPMAGWPTKRWTPAGFAALADWLIESHGAGVIVTGAVTDQTEISAITTRMQHTAVDLCGHTDLMTLAALYESVACLISTDTGPMHLAAAVGAPVVALFAPTAPWRTGPYGPGHIVVRPDVPCSPCFQRTAEMCQCMRQIDLETVKRKVESMLK